MIERRQRGIRVRTSARSARVRAVAPRRTSVAAGIAVALLAAAAAHAASAAAGPVVDPLAVRAVGPPPVLEPRWLYSGQGRPVPMEIRGRRDDAAIAVVLLDAAGAELARAPVAPGDVARGVFDLGTTLPAAWSLERAAWLQLLDDGAPVGAPVVVQPMLSRQVPVAELATNPSGIRYSRIVDWHDERVPPPAPRPAPGAGGLDAEAGGDGPEATDADLPDDGDALEPLRTGIRTWVDHDVVLRTTAGPLRFRMRPDEAPNTAWNFLALCAGGFYRDVAFHRIKPMSAAGDPFVIQAGDPSADGSGGPGYWLPMERSGLPHDFGVISMARDVDPDSAGSQFFVCLSRAGTARLDGHYVAFGELVDGEETVLRIADAELADFDAGRAVDPPRIVEASLIAAAPRVPGGTGGGEDGDAGAGGGSRPRVPR